MHATFNRDSKPPEEVVGADSSATDPRGVLWGCFILAVQTPALLWCILFLTARFWVDGPHFFSLPSGKILNDFLYFWGAARVFWNGHVHLAFHPMQFNSWLATQVAPRSTEAFATWSYPPTMLLFLLPLGLIPLPYAMIFWDVLTFLFLALVMFCLFRKYYITLSVIFSPAAMYCLLIQQNGALTAGILIAGIWLVDRRPIISGMCIGALVIKPQLAILLPFALAAGRHWKSFMAATLTSLFLIFASGIMFGFESWILFFRNTMPLMTSQLFHEYGIPPQNAMPTTFVTLQGWGANTLVASVGQGLSSLLAIAMTMRAWSANTNPVYRNALTCVAILLATPFGYIYDLIPAMLAVILVAQSRFSMDLNWWERLTLPSLWIWPIISTIWAGYFDLPPVGSVLLLAVAVNLLWRVEKDGNPHRSVGRTSPS